MKRTAIQRRAFRVCSSIVVIGLVIGATKAATFDWPFERELWIVRWTGLSTATALLLSLSIGPLRRLIVLTAATAISFRRALGMTAAWLALLHASCAAIYVIDPAWEALVHRAHYRSGLVALVVLSTLLLTSFPEIVKFFRIKLWSELHRLAYVVIPFVAHHVFLSTYASRSLALIVLSIAALGLLLRLLPVRRNLRQNQP